MYIIIFIVYLIVKCYFPFGKSLLFPYIDRTLQTKIFTKNQTLKPTKWNKKI